MSLTTLGSAFSIEEKAMSNKYEESFQNARQLAKQGQYQVQLDLSLGGSLVLLISLDDNLA